MRTVLGRFPTGVTVLTVGGPSPHGMTATSFTSVSLDPPLVLVCVNRDAVMHDLLAAASGWALSVLSADQEQLARHFTDNSRQIGVREFAGVGWWPGEHGGAPLLRGAVAWLECRPWRWHDGGDHTIAVGRLVSARATDGAALTFHDGRFGRSESVIHLVKEGH